MKTKQEKLNRLTFKAVHIETKEVVIVTPLHEHFLDVFKNKKWIMLQQAERTDVKGNLLYEGDILQLVYQPDQKGFVVFVGGCFELKKKTGHILLSEVETENIVCVGNIHVNPEVLKG